MKPIVFKVGKKIGGGICPVIECGDVVFTYIEDGLIYVVPIDCRYYEPRGIVYYDACSGTAEQFAKEKLNAVEIATLNSEAGEMVRGVWKPGLNFDKSFIDFNVLRRDKQELFNIISSLYKILLTVEPSVSGLSSYGSRIRDLHLLASMDVESYLRMYLSEVENIPVITRPNTADYVKLKEILHLHEYSVSFLQYSDDLSELRPFEGWNDREPTQSLSWYDGYNKSKHNRRENFMCSTLKSALDAVAAVIVLFAVRYGIRQLFSGGDMLSTLMLGGVEVRCGRAGAFGYVPRIEVQGGNPKGCTSYIQNIHEWRKVPLRV